MPSVISSSLKKSSAFECNLTWIIWESMAPIFLFAQFKVHYYIAFWLVWKKKSSVFNKLTKIFSAKYQYVITTAFIWGFILIYGLFFWHNTLIFSIYSNYHLFIFVKFVCKNTIIIIIQCVPIKRKPVSSVRYLHCHASFNQTIHIIIKGIFSSFIWYQTHDDFSMHDWKGTI